MTDNELKALVASIAEGQKKTDEQLKKTDEQLKKTDEQLQRTDAQLSKLGAKIDKVANMYGGMANNQGAATEEFYYNSLKSKPILQGIQFDVIYKNMTAAYAGIEDEYDIVLINGKAVYIIEVKYKVHLNDIEKLVTKKAKNFPKLFVEYANYQRYLGLACFYIDEETKKQALAQGVNVLQRKGNLIESLAA